MIQATIIENKDGTVTGKLEWLAIGVTETETFEDEAAVREWMEIEACIRYEPTRIKAVE